MTEQERIINKTHIMLSKALKSLGVREIDYHEENSLGITVDSYIVTIHVSAKAINKNKRP